ncbi:hypothetical protein CGI70_23970 [Vibrio parahaemolyticus]|nr:hypothetical protein CGI70_23970 [Vibrio parahaemolyticus]
MAINNKYAKYSIGFEEKIVCKNLDSFIEALLNFEIGVVLNKNKQEDIWLLKYVKAQVKASKNVIYGNDDITIDQLLPDIPDNEFQEYDDSYASGGISILIVSARP